MCLMAHFTRLILTETQEKSINSHAINTEEKGGNQVGTNNQNLKNKMDQPIKICDI